MVAFDPQSTLEEVDPVMLGLARCVASAEKTRCHLEDGSHLVAVIDVRSQGARSLIGSWRDPIDGWRLTPDEIKARGVFVPLVFPVERIAVHAPTFARPLAWPVPAGECRVFVVTPGRDFLVSVPFISQSTEGS